ncbi:hypothetical protein B0H34DRAFT_795737 [Crassisporium funariophilum]|nr:hypothetical protein B0H34DRAFT_795737 [Crassisporium funariophilum]
MAAIVADRDLPPLPVPSPSIRPSFESGSSSQSQSQPSHEDSRGPWELRTSRGSSSKKSRSLLHDERRRNSMLHELADQLLEEKSRSDDAERKLQEVTAHLKAVNDARLLALRDAARANEELKLYKIQLDNAQKEIYRAQDVIEFVDRQRYNAEKEAAKLRTRARQLNEMILKQSAREEAWKMGLQEGLDRGREVPPEEGQHSAYILPGEGGLEDDDYSSDGSRSSAPENVKQAYPSRPHSLAPSEHARSMSRQHASPSAVPIPLPSNPPTAPPSLHPSENIRPMSMRNPSPTPRQAPSSLHPSENIRPISMRNPSPTPRSAPIMIPPDNFIPSLGADNIIRIPPPFEFQRAAMTPDRATSPQLHAMSDSSQEPLMVPGPQPKSAQRKRYHRRNSSSGSNSSALSQLDIINDPYSAQIRTPMSMIPEVNSMHTASPLPGQSMDGDHSARHQRSFSGNSAHRSNVDDSQYGGNYASEAQSQHRPHSRSSYAGSYLTPSKAQRNSHISRESTEPEINIEPPSRPLSNKTASIKGTDFGGSPATSYGAPLPSASGRRSPHPLSNSSMPGGYENMNTPTHSVMQEAAGPSSASRRYRPHEDYGDEDDDAVSSAFSAATLTTPPAKGHKSMQPDWSGASAMASHSPVPPSSGTGGGWGRSTRNRDGSANGK